MSIVVFHPSTAPFVQHAAGAIYEAGLLERLYVALRDDPTSGWQRAACALARLGRRDLRRQLARRAVTEVPREKVTAYPVREIIRLLVGGLDRTGKAADRAWEWAEPAFDRRVARELHPGLTAVYGFEFSSLATFTRARTLGIRTIYDVPAPETNFVHALLDQEIARHPALDTAYHRHTQPREPRRTARRRAEWQAADIVIAASEFTKRTYVAAGLGAEKIRVVPYGAPPIADRAAALRGNGSTNTPSTFLWAGTFSIRKGAHHLLAAWRRIQAGRHARLKIFGAIALPDALLHPLPEGVEIAGSIPRSELMEQYRQADALIFPTLCDGFGMVATEAWSQGLPVITTDCAGAADLLRDRENGLLIPAGSVDAIAEAIAWALAHPLELRAMRAAALATAERWQWSDYRRALIAAIGPRTKP